jgi:hypothetical protein
VAPPVLYSRGNATPLAAAVVAVVVALRRRDGVAGAGRVGVAVTELAGAGACDSVPLLVRPSGAAVFIAAPSG